MDPRYQLAGMTEESGIFAISHRASIFGLLRMDPRYQPAGMTEGGGGDDSGESSARAHTSRRSLILWLVLLLDLLLRLNIGF
jgi:hypothetical protein